MLPCLPSLTNWIDLLFFSFCFNAYEEKQVYERSLNSVKYSFSIVIKTFILTDKSGPDQFLLRQLKTILIYCKYCTYILHSIRDTTCLIFEMIIMINHMILVIICDCAVICFGKFFFNSKDSTLLSKLKCFY